MKSLKQKLFLIATILATPVLLIAGCVSLDVMMYSRVKPTRDLKTIQDFERWKRGSVVRKGTYENNGKIYIVILGGAGRTLASGPAAYLFDQSGNYVDWTSDMGDFHTVKNGFDLSGGAVKDIQTEKY